MALPTHQPPGVVVVRGTRAQLLVAADFAVAADADAALDDGALTTQVRTALAPLLVDAQTSLDEQEKFAAPTTESTSAAGSVNNSRDRVESSASSLLVRREPRGSAADRVDPERAGSSLLVRREPRGVGSRDLDPVEFLWLLCLTIFVAQSVDNCVLVSR